MVLGTSFALLINSLVSDIFMPFVALIGTSSMRNTFLVLRAGNISQENLRSLADAEKSGAITVNYGKFFDLFVTFLIIAFILFLVIKLYMFVRRDRVS